MVEALLGMFALGTIGFWALCGVVCILLITFVEYEKPGWATLSLIATFALLGWLGDFKVWHAAGEHPLMALGAVASYLAVGTLWAFGKWWFFLKAARERYDEAKREFLAAHKVEGTKIPDHLLEKWREGQYDRFRRSALSAECGTVGVPKARQHKGRILTWMAYWPWSMVWTMINDPIKRLFKEIFRRVQVAFQKIADHVFADVSDDFRPPPPKAPQEDDSELSDPGLHDTRKSRSRNTER